MVAIKPPYIAIGWAESFFNLVKRVKLGIVDRHIIAQYNIASLGNASKVVSALKFLNIIDPKGKVIEENLNSLKLEGEQKKQGFKKIISRAYEDLINKINLSQAKEEDIINYFIGKYSYSSLQANGATRLFLHLSRKSELNLSEDLMKAAQPSNRGRPIGSKNEGGKKSIKKPEKNSPNNFQKSNMAINSDQSGDSINIFIRGKGLSLDLTLNTTEDIQPNLDIVLQILKLNLRKKHLEKKETSN